MHSWMGTQTEFRGREHNKDKPPKTRRTKALDPRLAPTSALRKGLLKANRADGVIGAAMENIDAAISLRRNKILRLW